MGSEGSPLQAHLTVPNVFTMSLNRDFHLDHPNSEKAHPLPWSEAPTFPLGPLFHTQWFSCCISISPPSFMTFVWIFLPPLTGKSSEPGLKSLRSLHARSQTAQKSLNMNYQAESARCHSEFFSGMAAVFTSVLNAFIPILFQSLAFPVALLVCSRLPLHSEDPSVSVWIKAALLHGWWQEDPAGVVMCTQVPSLWEVAFWPEMNGGFKSIYPPLGCSCPEQHFYSEVERRKGQSEAGYRLPVLGTHTCT